MASEPRPAGARTALGRFLQRGANRAPGGIVGAAGIVALGFLGSRLLGLLRSVAIADAFGMTL